MDKLWAPWRINYIRNNKKRKCCIFCFGSKHERQSYTFLKTKYSFAMLNIFPYNNGHILVSPRRHAGKLSQLKDVESVDLFKTLNRAVKLLDKVVKPDGYNIGINISRSAGAGVVSHLHIHIVPRWIGDTNFMTTLYDTKIISQSLNELFRRLKNAESKTN